MRDIIVVSIVLVCALIALRRPWVGVMLWTWLSLMNPHRYTYGFAFTAPLAAMAAVSTLLGLLFTKDRESPFKGSPVTWLVLFMAWITISWLFGLDAEHDYAQWDKVMKIDLMILVALALLRTRRQVQTLCWVVVGSLAILGAKGGLFTLATGGSYRVWGPEGSFIADNNEFALALVMTIPLLRFLQMQLAPGWKRHLMTSGMVLCAASALGSQSRGGLLAIGAMTLFLWARGKNKLIGGMFMLLAATALVAFMPESWSDRMSTIQEYQDDRSALGRISAWWTAWGIALHYPLGVGFNTARPELFAAYSPYPEYIHAAHSIYFQVLGNHGFIGLFLFLGIFVSTYIVAHKLRREARAHPQAQWCEQLAAMCQVSLIGYFVGGAFLSLAYFDLPYNVMVMVVLARRWVLQRGWEGEAEAEKNTGASLRLAPSRQGG